MFKRSSWPPIRLSKATARPCSSRHCLPGPVSASRASPAACRPVRSWSSPTTKCLPTPWKAGAHFRWRQVMRLDTHLSQRMEQTMRLAPRMIQSMEILQLPIMALQERIQQELQENPVLELKEPGDESAPEE